MNEREKILDEIVKVFGFESPVTITFAHMIENPNYTESYLRYMSEETVKNPEEWAKFYGNLWKTLEALDEVVTSL